MGNFWKKAFGSVGVKEDEYDEYFEENEQSAYQEEEQAEDYVGYEEPNFSRSRSKVISMPQGRRASETGSAQMQMIIFRPTSYDQTQSVIDNLKSRKPIIVNLDEIDVAVAQRILDFISGAVYALGGDIKKAARNIFVVVPSNVEIAESIEDAAGSFDSAYMNESL